MRTASRRTGSTLFALGCGLAMFLAQASSVQAVAASRPESGGYWVLTGSPPVAVGHQTATLLRTGDVLAVGGCPQCIPNYVQLYHPSTGSWSLTTQTPHPYNGATATMLQSGRVLIAGGYTGEGDAIA